VVLPSGYVLYFSAPLGDRFIRSAQVRLSCLLPHSEAAPLGLPMESRTLEEENATVQICVQCLAKNISARKTLLACSSANFTSSCAKGITHFRISSSDVEVKLSGVI